MKDLRALLTTVDANADLATRHIWLIDLLAWVRGKNDSVGWGGSGGAGGSDGSVAASLARVQALIDALHAQPEAAQRLRAWWQTLCQTLDVTTLLADFGFAPRTAFFSELAGRLRRKLLPGTPETIDAAELFALALGSRFDALWLAALPESQIQALVGLLSSDVAADTLRWQHQLMDALTYCTAQIRATGFAPELRLRMDSGNDYDRAFHPLSSDLAELRQIFFDPAHGDAALKAAIAQLRGRLETCRQATNGVYTHLDENGVSVGMVFMLRQLRERIVRVRELLDALTAAHPAQAAIKLLARRVTIGQDSKSIGALIRANSTLLSAKMAERSAETGEHYITRDKHEYRDMLGKAMGGGAVTALTTGLKFAVMALGLSAFWNGLAAGVVYAASFVLIQLLHLTLATKQPAMTAPAMAAKLKGIHDRGSEANAGQPQASPVQTSHIQADRAWAVDDFVDEVTHLVRSQVAAVLGNVAMVVPAVLLVNALLVLLRGQPMISPQEAEHVLHSLTVLGPTLLWAAFTGVVLFTSSVMAGWFENWFVLHRLGSAIRYNPRITAVLGTARAARWAVFMRHNVSGFASNISLGLMLGLIPAFTGFFGFELQVRHVTLSAGQLAAAGAALGLDAFSQPLVCWSIWWGIVSIPLIGALNLSVSFYCAFRLALQAHNVSGVDRGRIGRAIWARWRNAPRSFFVPR